MPISEARSNARMPAHLLDATSEIAAAHGRTLSEEVRRALELWTTVAATATSLDDDVAEQIEPAILEGRIHELRHVAVNRIGDAFPQAEPEHVLAALAGASGP